MLCNIEAENYLLKVLLVPSLTYILNYNFCGKVMGLAVRNTE